MIKRVAVKDVASSGITWVLCSAHSIEAAISLSLEQSLLNGFAILAPFEIAVVMGSTLQTYFSEKLIANVWAVALMMHKNGNLCSAPRHPEDCLPDQLKQHLHRR